MLSHHLIALLAFRCFTAASVVDRFTNLWKRAGGPALRAIPSSCTVINPLGCSGQSCSPVQQSTNVEVLDNTVLTAQIYAFYIPQDDISAAPSIVFQECLDQCYGYGDVGNCVAAFQAYDVAAPAAFGVDGPTVSCQFFNRSLNPNDFQLSPNAGVSTDASAGNIQCGSAVVAAQGTPYLFATTFDAVQPPMVSLASSTQSGASPQFPPFTPSLGTVTSTPMISSSSSSSSSSSMSSALSNGGASSVFSVSSSGANTPSPSSSPSSTPNGVPIVCPPTTGVSIVNYETYTNSNSTYDIDCYTDYQLGNLPGAAPATNTFNECLDLCSATTDCIAVDWTIGGGVCYMKSSIGALSYSSGVYGGRLIASSSTTSSINSISSISSISSNPNLGSPSARSSSSSSSSGVSSFSITSSTITLSTSSSSASSAATASSYTCPDSDGTTYTDSNGVEFAVQCFEDTVNGNLPEDPVSASSLEVCMSICATTSGCLRVSYNFGASECYLKNNIGTAVYNQTNVWGAQIVSGTASALSSAPSSSSSAAAVPTATASALPTYSTCPSPVASPGYVDYAAYTDQYGVFNVSCAVELPNAANIAVNGGTGYFPQTLFTDCMDRCGALGAECVGVVWVRGGGNCYLKSALGPTAHAYNEGTDSAVLVARSYDPVTTTTTTTLAASAAGYTWYAAAGSGTVTEIIGTPGPV